MVYGGDGHLADGLDRAGSGHLSGKAERDAGYRSANADHRADDFGECARDILRRVGPPGSRTDVAKAEIQDGVPAVIKIPKPELWSPDHPVLYDIEAVLKKDGRVLDEVTSYAGMRKISLGKDDQGYMRLLLNNRPLFQLGPLDQGWWPDGLYTAPTDAALQFDVETIKALGMNMLRKHVKVEPDRLYYWCDKLGLFVWQDMPSALLKREAHSPDVLAQRDAQWEGEWKAVTDALRNHPSIVMCREHPGLGRSPADLRRIPRPAGVALAVVLDVVGPDAVEQAADHLLGDVGTQGCVRLVGMEVEVEAEEGVPAGGGGCGGIDWQGPWRRGRKRRWRQGRAERTNPAAFYRRES